jgi:hypothetical protein
MSGLIYRLRERAGVARSEKTGTGLGDAVHFEEAADRIDCLENMLSTILHEWVPSDESDYADAVKLLEGSSK